MIDFEHLWRFLIDRNNNGIPLVQERSEMEYIYGLIKDAACENYLEIGSAEGNSLYVYGNIVHGEIHYVDIGEAHTAGPRSEVLAKLGTNKIHPHIGNSMHPGTYNRIKQIEFDCVFIDGGHDYKTVLSDCTHYVPLAKKYVFWHDVQIPEVRCAIEEYLARGIDGEYSTFINSDTYGYGILRKKQ